MNQVEFNRLWANPPVCEQSMVLLKRWHDTDSGAIALLLVLTADPEQPLCIDPDVENFVRHVVSCRECAGLWRKRDFLTEPNEA